SLNRGGQEDTYSGVTDCIRCVSLCVCVSVCVCGVCTESPCPDCIRCVSVCVCVSVGVCVVCVDSTCECVCEAGVRGACTHGPVLGVITSAGCNHHSTRTSAGCNHHSTRTSAGCNGHFLLDDQLHLMQALTLS